MHHHCIIQPNEAELLPPDPNHLATLPDSQTVDHNGDPHIQTMDTPTDCSATDCNTWHRYPSEP